ARIVLVDHLPTTTSGKIDRKALSRVAVSERSLVEHDEDYRDWTETERSVALIWERLLGTSPIGRDESFLELGGDSLLAARLLVETYTQVGATPPFSALFGNPTIRVWSAHVERAVAEAASVEAPASDATTADSAQPFPLLVGQRQIVLLDQLARPLP